MPINYYCAIAMNGSDIEMNRNELLLPVIDNETSAPATGSEVEGQMYYNTSTNIMYFYNGSAWVEMDGTGSGVSSLAGGTSTYITNSVNASTGAVTLTSTLAGGSGTGTEFYRGDGTWATPAGAYTKWQYKVNSGTAIDMIDGEILNFISSTGIGLAGTAASPNTLTISNTGVTSIAAGTGISVSGSTGAVTVTNTVANTTSLGIANSGGTEQFTVTDTVDLQFAASGGASVAFDSTNKRVTYTAPSNTNETYTLPVAAGGANSAVLNLTAGGTGSGIKSSVTINGDSNTVKVTESTGNNGSITLDLQDDVTIAASLTVTTDLNVGDDIALTGGTSKITGLVTNQITNDTDAANKKYVDDLVAGGLTFKDGFNAGTGAIDGGGNLTTGGSRVAVSIGDYYVVTTAGSFYGSVALDVGDSVIARLDAAAGTSDVNDWVIIQGDEGVVSIGLTTGASTGAPLTANATSGAITLTSRSYDGGSKAGYVPVGGSASTFLRGDGSWVTPTNSGGTITSIDITETGTALTVTETGSATDPNFNISGAGTSSQVVLGDLTLASLPSSYTGWTASADSGSASVDSGGTLIFDGGSGQGITTLANNSGTGGTVNFSLDIDNLAVDTGVQTSDFLALAPSGGSTKKATIATILALAPQGDIENVSEATANNRLGIDILAPGGPDVTVGLDVVNLTNLSAAPATDDELIIYDTSTATNKAVTVANLAAATHDANSYAATITGFGTVTHNLGSYDVIVQLYNASNYETIYACVDRTSTNAVGISGGSFPAGQIRVLITKVIA